MKLEEAAFVNLSVFARMDGPLAQSELDLLERYREALGVTPEFAQEILAEESLATLQTVEIKGKPTDRLHILKMMIRLAHADGILSDREKKRIRQMARAFGTGGLALKNIFWEIEQELGIRRRLRFSQKAVLGVILVSAVVIVILFQHFSSRAVKELDGSWIGPEEFEARLGTERARAEEALQAVRQSQENLTRSEAALKENLDALARSSADERKALKTTMTEEQHSREEEIKRLQAELALVRTLNMVFQEIEREYNPSILLIFTQYEMVLDKQRVPRGAMGTGFFVTSTGRLVTNKHVVQPWKFNADDAALMGAGFKPDPATLLMAAWPAGREVKTSDGHLNLDTAYTTAMKQLRLEKTTPDTLAERVEILESGGLFQGKLHTMDQGDLAVLKADPAGPVKALPLADESHRLEKLDPVMVLGFPTGLSILETTRTETSPSLGEVRKIEKSIMVTAPIFPGNSGGPLMDQYGRVVGVAAGIFGDATLGSCIPSEHILPLLPTGAEVLSDAADSEKAGAFGAALDDLRLADQLCKEKEEVEQIRKTRERLFKIRDGMASEADGEKDPEKQKKALKTMEDAFGSFWAKAAATPPR